MPTKNRTERIRHVAFQRQEGVVVLEDIHDPHNAAAVLRTCEAFGFQKVYFIFEKQKKFNPRKIGKATSSSANKWLDFQMFDSTEKCLKDLKKQGYATYATVLDKGAGSLFKTHFPKPKIALLFGNEHSGLSKKAVNMADKKIYIPMGGFVQSLNLSVSAAICLFELSRQRQKHPADFLLPKTHRLQLQKNWLKK
ncbi:MAG: RNA methyltransferase [Patescibacteria group bacterium]|nr:RNA methyltransferase [Patescibacteria group bacterium]